MSLKNNKSLHNYLQYASLRLDKHLELRFPIFLSLFSVGSTVLSMYLTIKKLLWHISKHKEKVEQGK